MLMSWRAVDGRFNRCMRGAGPIIIRLVDFIATEQVCRSVFVFGFVQHQEISLCRRLVLKAVVMAQMDAAADDA